MTLARSLRRRMLVVSIAIATLLTVATLSLLRTTARQQMVERLHTETALLADQARTASAAGAQSFAVRAGQVSRLRVTVIGADGTVLGDSTRDAAGVAAMDNHLQRPEVQAARLRGSGDNQRRSSTTRVRYFYSARRVSGEAPIRYVRIAIPVNQLPRPEPRDVAVVGAMFVAAGLLLTAVAVSRVTRTSRELLGLARAIDAAPDAAPGLSVSPDAGDELRRLAATVKQLNRRLGDKLVELDAERLRLESVVGALRGGLLLVDGERRIRLANRAFREIFELAFDPVGHLLTEAVRHPRITEAVEQALDQRREIRLDNVSLESTGRSFEVHVSPLPLREPDRGTEALVLLFDVTRLELLENVRRQFVANVSHELRTPITSIKIAVENLLSGGMDDPVHGQRFLQMVQRHADRMGELIEDLTDLSLIETGSVRLERRQVNAAAVAREIAESLRPLALDHRVRLEVELPDRLEVVADRGRLEQMLSNLITNAIKFNRPDGCVTLCGGLRDDAPWISVADTGIGISSADRQKIFNRFYQVDPGRSRQVGGTGLGLAIVKHLMRLHGGRVAVESELGHGATFTLQFPGSQPAETEPTQG